MEWKDRLAPKTARIFVSTNIHESLDGTRVANYAQWRSVEDFQAMLRNPEAIPHMGEAAAMASTFDPNMYEVVNVHRKSG